MFKEPSGPDHGVRNPEGFDAEGRLDHHWVTRWLDDVGLPQYKVTVSMVSGICISYCLVHKCRPAQVHCLRCY